MNYPQSQEILEKIKKANNIIVNCHYSPDPDSVCSALAMYKVLSALGKNVYAYSPGDIGPGLSFLPFVEKISVVDFTKIDYLDVDLFIALDSSTWDQAIGSKEFPLPESLDCAVIDHHKSNAGYGSVNLVVGNSVSTCEVLYEVFEDWKVEIDKNLATILLTGIIADSGAFRFPATTAKTLEIASKLMRADANKDEIVFNIYQSTDFEVMKFWGLALSKLKLEDKYAWVAISNDEFKNFNKPTKAKSSFASVFLQSVQGTDFAFIAVEEKPGLIDVSLRSRTGFDTSIIATEFGGGGHIWASGLRIEGLSFDDAIRKLLDVVNKHIN